MVHQSKGVVHVQICEIDRGFIALLSSHNKLKVFRYMSSLNICYISGKFAGKLPPHTVVCVNLLVSVCDGIRMSALRSCSICWW